LLANAFGHALQLRLTHCIRQQAGSYGHASEPASKVTRPARPCCDPWTELKSIHR
jgi:hypothetical protein